MLKAYIIVTRDMDVAGELSKLQRLAEKHRFTSAKSHLMLEHVEALITNVSETLSELSTSGISTAIKKIASSEDYQVTLEANQGHSGKSRGRSLFSFLRL
ncbi:MAG: hypothetical protein WCE83_02315 [Candidatus Baltobacteraceae bacterium]